MVHEAALQERLSRLFWSREVERKKKKNPLDYGALVVLQVWCVHLKCGASFRSFFKSRRTVLSFNIRLRDSEKRSVFKVEAWVTTSGAETVNPDVWLIPCVSHQRGRQFPPRLAWCGFNFRWFGVHLSCLPHAAASKTRWHLYHSVAAVMAGGGEKTKTNTEQ